MFAKSLILVLMALVVCANGQAQADFPVVVSTSLKQDLASKVQLGYDTMKRNLHTNLRASPESDGKFSSYGFVFSSLYVGSVGADATCSAPSSMYGEAVNRCFSNGFFSYKYQLIEDSCNGAIIQYYADKQCRIYLGSNSLDQYEGSCHESKNMYMFSKFLGFPAYQALQCTTATAPVVPPEPFKEPTCKGLDVVFQQGRAQEACTYSASVGYFTHHNCSTSVSMAFDFSATSCSGDVEELSAVCYREGYDEFLSRDDDDQNLQDMDASATDDTILRILDGAVSLPETLKDGALLRADALAADTADTYLSRPLQLELDQKEVATAARAEEESLFEAFDDDAKLSSLEATYFLGTCSLQQAVPLSLEFLPMLDSPDDDRVGRIARQLTLTGARKWVVTHRSTSSLSQPSAVLGVPLAWAVLGSVSALALMIFCSAMAAMLYAERKAVPVVITV